MEIVVQGRRGKGNRVVPPVPAAPSTPSATSGRKQPDRTADAPEGGGAGLPVAATSRFEGSGRPRFGVAAPLVTQLIAGQLHLPQTRNLRRAAPADACIAYQEAAERRRAATAPRRSGMLA